MPPPNAVPDATPDATPDAAPDAAPDATTNASSGDSGDALPAVAPDTSRDASPAAPPDASPAERLRLAARSTFGWSELSNEQLAAMEQIMAGGDVLVVLPTGAGKSAIYQVPAVLLDGPTVVVSPLIALQRDQVAGLAESQAPRAVAVNSAQRGADTERAWAAFEAGHVEYLFLSPEQLAKDDVVARLAAATPSLFVVDEAHCVSSWGHDFRPDYLRLSPVAERLGHPTVVAMTATASPPVRADIVDRLGLRDHVEVVASFDRPNLHLEVTRFQDYSDKRRAIVERATGKPNPGLVYVATRNDAESYAAELADRGVAVEAYHAGMRAGIRQQVQRRFMAGELDVIVATSAFGMGIDKADVRFVAHASIPASLDAYYQEIGRAGRDGEPADAVLFYRPEDLGLQKFLTTAKANEDDLRLVASAVLDNGEPITSAQLRRQLDLPGARRTRAVNLLEKAGALTVVGHRRFGYTDAGVPPPAAAARAMQVAEAHQRLIRSQLEMMRGYAETAGCRRQHLLGYFGEQLDEPCGNCDRCAAEDLVAADQPEADSDLLPNAQVRHPEWGDGAILRVEDDRVTVLFEEFGYKTLSRTVVRDNDLLTPLNG